MSRIQIQHTTRYRFSDAVTLLPHTLHLRPREGHDIRVLSSRLDISPEYQVFWKRDIYGNSVAVVQFMQPASELVIASEVVVKHYEDEPMQFVLEDYAQHFPFHYDPAQRIDLAPYQGSIFPDDQSTAQEWAADIFNSEVHIGTIGLLTSLNRKIANELQYQVREEPGVQSPAQTLSAGSGSCRDFAVLFMEICRYYGFASRFISGYVLNDSVVDGNTATHAWSEVFLPGSGWRGFDSSSGLVVSGEHIAVAVHRHPQSIPPVAGTFIGSAHTQSELFVEVHVNHLES